MIEIWKDIPGHVNYQVSNIGRVRSVSGFTERMRDGKIQKLPLKGKVLRPILDGGKYHFVQLHKKNCKIHRLVAELFIPNPENKRTVNHINGDKSDNSISNLEWATYSENITHAFRVLKRTHYQTGKSGILHRRSKQVLSINQLSIIEHGSILECARYFSVNGKTIANYIKSGFSFRGNILHLL